ncbi:hypothetical protein C1H46_035603 [Malus baccata]|uniref:Uncharacterized protein n=1 Tax=Malus baccata TaxID=106549 RepID=A0A540KX76_MALBA|nr:hypothetical protein C1H46_035603 [Malus baccata]
MGLWESGGPDALHGFDCVHFLERCNTILNRKLPSPHQTLLTISATTTSLFNARVVRSGGIASGQVGFSPIKINVDASWRTSNNQGHVGLVV